MQTVRSSLEVADILRAYLDSYRSRQRLSPEQAVVVRHLVTCRTAALGGHRDHCAACGYVRISYNSCRDRHCPKCQGAQRAAWLESRLQRLLPVEYFHVVFTLPDGLYPLVLQNKAVLYDLFFATAAQTLLTLAADPKRLGAQIGFTAILHTWGQKLLFHPHLHCVVTGGGLTDDGSRWIAGRRGYFLPVKVLGRLFRGKFLAGLKQAYHDGQLQMHGALATLVQPQVFRRWLDPWYRKDWVIYAKRPFGGATQVFRYLGRYSHRVAISNGRLVSMDAGQVRFRYKDYADGHQLKVMTVAAAEFIRRFLLHVLPKQFVRIRHYGLLASRNVATKLARCRQLLHGEALPQRQPPKTLQERVQEWTGQDPLCCPRCQQPLTRQTWDRGDPQPLPRRTDERLSLEPCLDST
jgi:hypothetical protein